jgi:SAM-dependent methyltransferase
MSAHWNHYYQVTTGRKPRPLLLDALSRFGEYKGFAIDLGCGAGADAAEILRQGWKLLAIDQQPEAVEMLRQRVSPSLHSQPEEQARALLAPLEIEFFEVEDHERQVATQGVQWVHAFSIIARKPGGVKDENL